MKNSDSRQHRQRQSADAIAPLAVAPRARVLAAPTGEAPKAVGEASLPDLRQEAANMVRLALAQEGAGTPLELSSRQAQVVLGQF